MKFQLPRNILFDMDGTLLDSFPGIAFSINEACRTIGLPEPKANLRSLLGPPVRTIFSAAVPTNDTSLLDRLEVAFRSSYDAVGWKRTSSFENVSEVLTLLQANKRQLFVVSNKPRHISLRILEHEGLLPYFTRIYTIDSRVPPYPSKEDMLGEFLSEYGISPSDCLMVGDTMEDIIASEANQIPAAFIEHGYGEIPTTFPLQLRLRSFSDFLGQLVMENTNDRS